MELRWKLRFENYASVLGELQMAVEKEEYTALERAGLIQQK